MTADRQAALATFLADFRADALAPATIDQARFVIADTIAAIACGAAEPEVQAITGRIGGPPGPASVIGVGRTAAPAEAALLNGIAGTWLELDEGNRFSRGHPAIHVLPAALAHAEAHSAPGPDLIAAFVLGYEVAARIGIAAQLRPSMHPHGTWGTIGAAVAVAKLAGLDAPAIAETINVASSLTLATSKKTMLEGGTVRNVYAGVSNRMGLLAVDLVAAGFSGERDGLASVFGSVVSETFDGDGMIRGLGDGWQIERNYFKRHACCRYNHGTLDALDGLLANRIVRAEEIDRVEVASYRFAAELDDRAPRNVLAAKFSVPFAVATRIVTGESGVESFTWERVRDARIQALAARVSVHEDAALTRMLPEKRPARVALRLKDGSRLEGAADFNRGDDADPYDRSELTEKFHELTGRVWPRGQADAVRAAIDGLDRAPGLGALTAAIRG